VDSQTVWPVSGRKTGPAAGSAARRAGNVTEERHGRCRGGVRWLKATIVVGASLVAVACNGEAKSDDAADAPSAVLIGRENVVTVERGTLIAGPIVSGELRPQREAVLRAQLGGEMLQVAVEEGESVGRDTLLGRIDAKTLEESRRSVESAVRSADNQVQVARREVDRVETLVQAGALAARELDLARNALTSAEAQLADARSRLVAAERQLADAVVRSPMAGIVAGRAVNAGDIVSPGTELFTVVDPSSMRLEASVPSESLSELRIGAPVVFDVRGYPQPFQGRLERVAPRTDAATRQLPIYVSIPNAGGKLVGGLFAEGRVVAQSAEGLVVPIAAVNRTGEKPWVLRVADGTTERVDVALGLVDPRTERVQVRSGVNEGDILLRGAAQGIAPGTRVQVGGLK
jgi:RND family efflux transporter MFP subunit